VLACCALATPAPARAQGAKPLRKVELVRLLGSRALSKPAIAALVRRNCVTFRPTARDRADLRLAGADDAVFAAIDQCLRARAAAAQALPPVAAPAPAQPRRAPLRMETSGQVNALAGTEAEVVVQLYRGTVPQAGVALVLRGARGIPGGLSLDPVALTDQRGAATFHVLAGTTPGTYSLTLAVQNGAAVPGEIQFVTMPPAGARAEAPAPPPPPPPAPPRVPAVQFTEFSGAGQHGAPRTALPKPLFLEVRDETGKPITGEAVTFAITSGAVTPRVAASDSAGVIPVRVTLGERAGPVVITANVGSFIRTTTVYADPGPPHELVVERGDAPVVGGVVIRSRDTVVLRVVALDAYGNRTTLENFSATTSGRAVALRSAEARDSIGIMKLEPRRNGPSTIDVSASGLRVRAAVEVALPAAPGSPWAIGIRGGWLGANTPWLAVANLTGISGPEGSVFGRRALAGGVSVALGGEVGSLTLDRSIAGSVSATLLEGYARVEWALVPRGPVSPVVSLGGGGYRVKSSDDGQTVYHTNAFWSGGVGVDVELSPTVTAEARFERQWFRDTGFGHVGTLWPLEAGFRIGL
jgi:hypothetical protein